MRESEWKPECDIKSSPLLFVVLFFFDAESRTKPRVPRVGSNSWSVGPRGSACLHLRPGLGLQACLSVPGFYASPRDPHSHPSLCLHNQLSTHGTLSPAPLLLSLESRSQYITQTGLELVVLLPQLSSRWYYRWMPPLLTCKSLVLLLKGLFCLQRTGLNAHFLGLFLKLQVPLYFWGGGVEVITAAERVHCLVIHIFYSDHSIFIGTF